MGLIGHIDDHRTKLGSFCELCSKNKDKSNAASTHGTENIKLSTIWSHKHATANP